MESTHRIFLELTAAKQTTTIWEVKMNDQLVKVNKLLYFNLNADASCVSIGTRSGLYVYNLVSESTKKVECVWGSFVYGLFVVWCHRTR
jgi:hypothetical protein